MTAATKSARVVRSADTIGELVDMVEAHVRRQWGHGLDNAIDRAAVELVLADRFLSAVAGSDEATENAAYRRQCVAFNAWWEACKQGERHPDSHVMDVSYGWAAREVREATR